MQAERRTTLNLAVRQRVAISAFLVFLLDFLSKSVALHVLSDQPVEVIGKFLQLRLRYNSGAAFSIGTSHTIFFTSLAIGVLFILFYLATKIANFAWAIAMGIACGGIFGNLSDRIFRPPGALQGQVIDWIELPHWPTFNIADTAIFCAATWAVILTFRNISPTRFQKGS